MLYKLAFQKLTLFTLPRQKVVTFKLIASLVGVSMSFAPLVIYKKCQFLRHSSRRLWIFSLWWTWGWLIMNKRLVSKQRLLPDRYAHIWMAILLNSILDFILISNKLWYEFPKTFCLYHFFNNASIWANSVFIINYTRVIVNHYSYLSFVI